MTADGADGAAIRCLVVDDQAMVRESFAVILAAQPGIIVVGQAADGALAVRETARLAPDVVLLDVRMPVMDGLAAAREILSCGEPRPRVLMLTTFDLDDYVYEALRAGASGFLLKDAGTAELVRAVRVVAAGDALLAPSVTRRLTTVSELPARCPAVAPGSAGPRAIEALLRAAAGNLGGGELAVAASHTWYQGTGWPDLGLVAPNCLRVTQGYPTIGEPYCLCLIEWS